MKVAATHVVPTVNNAGTYILLLLVSNLFGDF